MYVCMYGPVQYVCILFIYCMYVCMYIRIPSSPVSLSICVYICMCAVLVALYVCVYSTRYQHFVTRGISNQYHLLLYVHIPIPFSSPLVYFTICAMPPFFFYYYML